MPKGIYDRKAAARRANGRAAASSMDHPQVPVRTRRKGGRPRAQKEEKIPEPPVISLDIPMDDAREFLEFLDDANTSGWPEAEPMREEFITQLIKLAKATGPAPVVFFKIKLVNVNDFLEMLRESNTSIAEESRTFVIQELIKLAGKK